jgi:hypothetical protein
LLQQGNCGRFANSTIERETIFFATPKGCNDPAIVGIEDAMGASPPVEPLFIEFEDLIVSLVPLQPERRSEELFFAEKDYSTGLAKSETL